MSVLAVIDTNVIVSVLLTKNQHSAAYQVIQAVLDGRIIPLYHPDIIAEYREVMTRPKFHIPKEDTDALLRAIETLGINVTPYSTGELLPDSDDLIFYEIVMAKRDDNAYLVTGNKKHFPLRTFIVTPAEMMKIL